MTFENWRTRLEAFPWWDAPGEWAETAYEKSWFISPKNFEGYFLVETKYDTYDVRPPKYDVSDSYYEERWWVKNGRQVQIAEMGKWQFLFGLRGPNLPNALGGVPQEVWILVQGGWSQYVTYQPNGSLLERELEIKRRTSDPDDFRGYLANSIGLSEYDLWGLSTLLGDLNLGFAIVPNHGRVETYEMDSLETATGDPGWIMNNSLPCQDMHKIGIGLQRIRVGDRTGYEPVAERWYTETVEAINRPLSSPKQFADAFKAAIGRERVPKWILEFGKIGFMKKRDPLKHLGNYLASEAAQRHFRSLRDAGYAVAIIPLGGRTLWSP